MASIDLVFSFKSDESVSIIAIDTDYFISHPSILDTEIVEYDVESSTINVRCQLNESSDIEGDVIPNLDYGFYFDDKREAEYDTELIDSIKV